MPVIASVRPPSLVPALVVLAALVAGAGVAAGAACLLPPVQAPVVDAFRSPGVPVVRRQPRPGVRRGAGDGRCGPPPGAR